MIGRDVQVGRWWGSTCSAHQRLPLTSDNEERGLQTNLVGTRQSYSSRAYARLVKWAPTAFFKRIIFEGKLAQRGAKPPVPGANAVAIMACLELIYALPFDRIICT